MGIGITYFILDRLINDADWRKSALDHDWASLPPHLWPLLIILAVFGIVREKQKGKKENTVIDSILGLALGLCIILAIGYALAIGWNWASGLSWSLPRIPAESLRIAKKENPARAEIGPIDIPADEPYIEPGSPEAPTLLQPMAPGQRTMRIRIDRMTRVEWKFAGSPPANAPLLVLFNSGNAYQSTVGDERVLEQGVRWVVLINPPTADRPLNPIVYKK